MTMRKKLIITIMALSCVLCILVTGTLAWLTDTTTSIKNTFAPANIDIEITETQKGVDYTFDMVPGKNYFKNPTVEVTKGSLKCYLFVVVDIQNNTFTVGGNTYNFIDYAIDSDWTLLSGNVYYLVCDASGLNANMGAPILACINQSDDDHENCTGCVTVNDDITKSIMPDIGTAPTFTFTAYAVQFEALTDQNGDAKVDVNDAWKLVNP